MQIALNNPSFIVTLALYSSIALALGLGTSILLRRHACRAFGVLWLAMLAAVLLPVGSWTVKQMQWGLLTEPRPTVDVTPWDEPIEASDTLALAEPIAPPSNERGSSPAPAQATPIQPKHPLPWNTLLLTGWGLLSLALLLRLAVRWTRMLRLLNQCTSSDSNSMDSLIPKIPAHLQPSKPICILSHPRLRTPAIWCWGRELRLLIPAKSSSSTDWASVFCHELAHAQRRDHITGLMSEILVCLLPWQPLLWWTKHRLALLSEQACDDWVLASGRTGTDYAESLLNLIPQPQAAFVPAMASSSHGIAGRIERILQNQCSNPRPGRAWSLVITLAAAILVTGIALAQTRSSINEDALFGSPPFGLVLRTPEQSDTEYGTLRTQAEYARREIDLSLQPGESEAELAQRHWDAAVRCVVYYLQPKPNDSPEDSWAHYTTQLTPLQKSIYLTQEPNENHIGYVIRLAQKIYQTAKDNHLSLKINQHPGESDIAFRARKAQELAQGRAMNQKSSLSLFPYSSTEIKQNPGESDAAFRARRARALAKQRADNRNNLRNGILLFPSNPIGIQQNPGESDAAFRARRARVLAKMRAGQLPSTFPDKQPGESQQSYQLRVLEDALNNAQLIIPYEPGENWQEYESRRESGLTEIFSHVNLVQEANENNLSYRKRLVEEIRNATPTSWLAPRPEQWPDESKADFSARCSREHKNWQQNLALGQRPDEDTAAYQQRLFETAVRESQVYIPYQTQETAEDYHARRERELEQLKAQLPLSPEDNQDLVTFHQHLVEQIQALIPTQYNDLEIKQNPGESDAAFRARRARELAKQRTQARTSTASRVAYGSLPSIDIKQNPGESDAAFRARRARALAKQRAAQRAEINAQEIPLASDPEVKKLEENLILENIQQNPGESDAAFRARRARELAKQKAAQRNEH